MRANKPGRPPKIANIKERVLELRGFDLSFTEIGRIVGISKQLVQYHYTHPTPIDKDLAKKLR